ncbi:hypothetical protein AURDEDRAFT_176404 [Auricularia subglabra TFB-10046 SS5]|uniref:F-box domain-containing protein n=1 Tax=Auricularia subglabra (strain TFB-10046 / SS5) TaxID=717982 RepID=J0CVW2_AURST|nr:hypothetical protein AURDEDRAFT_176404 [Auricularia subglabra TFB-10046 SS5]
MAQQHQSDAHEAIHTQIITELVVAAGMDLDAPLSAWGWSPSGVQKMRQLALEMDRWIGHTVEFLGAHMNECNPVNRLPPEVLCMIFQYAAAGDFVEQLPFAAVCRRWRAISLDNKSLWSKVHVVSGDITPRVALNEVAFRLAYAGTAPTDVTLHCREPAPDGYLDPLGDHLSHIRTLSLRVPRDMLQQNLRASLTMPAPYLVSLELVILDMHGVEADDYPIFPHDVFSGDAPKLGTVFLSSISLPPAAWAPLHHLEHLNFMHDSVHMGNLVQVLRACRSLRTCYIKTQGFTLPANWPGTPSPPTGRRRLETMYINVRGLEVSDILRLLFESGLETPRNSHVTWSPLEDAREWLTPRDSPHAIITLHIYPTFRGASYSGARVITMDADDTFRSAPMKLPLTAAALHKFRRVFPSLRRLTIAEHMWPSPQPILPQLDELTIVMNRPTNRDPSGTGAVLGIFFLPFVAGLRWPLPALRVLQLTYLDPTRDNLYLTGQEKIALRGPLIISAYNVALFLEWHLSASQTLDVVLRNILLYEEDGHPDAQRLRSLVHGVDQHLDYHPEGYELGDEPDRGWPY